MGTTAQKIARLDRSIARTGETVTIQRTVTAAATGNVTVIAQLDDCPAHVRASAPQDLVEGGVRETRVILSATHLLTAEGSPPAVFGLPLIDDRILIQDDPSNIVEVAPIYYGGELVRVNLLCRG
jgi:hypothetical protein